MIDDRSIRRFLTNFFAFPEGHFLDHSADELNISEEERQELIKLHTSNTLGEQTSTQKWLAEFEKEMLERDN